MRHALIGTHIIKRDGITVNDLNIGLDWELGRRAYSVRHHYMDTKRHNSEEFLERAGQHAKRLIRQWVPDVLIAVDDNAQELAAKAFINHPEIHIVYTGVNADPAKYGYDENAANVTGLLERIPFASRELCTGRPARRPSARTGSRISTPGFSSTRASHP